MKINMKEMKENVDRSNELTVSELQMLADMIAKNNPKYKKYLEAKKCEDENLGMFVFMEMNYKAFIDEVISMYIEDFEDDYQKLFIRNCAFIHICSTIDINRYEIKTNKIIFYATIDTKKAYMEVEIIDILIGILLSITHSKVYDIIHRELMVAPIKYIQ